MVMLSLQCAIVGQAGSTFDVEIDDGQKVSKLKKAIKAENTNDLKHVDADKLQLFLAKKDEGRGAWLTDAEVTHGMIDISGLTLLKVAAAPLSLVGYTEIDVRIQVTMEDVAAGNVPVHVLVKLPEQDARIPIVPLPRTTPLNDPEKFAEECISLHEWDTQAVHEIPSIWRFMRNLGGCNNMGKIFWRMEDKQIASLLLDGWFGESYPELADKRSIVIGSPGIGKSTLLCVMAFHLVFKHKKNVLVYRRLGRRGDCLLYLGYENDKVVHFAIQMCEPPYATNIYKELICRHGILNVWLLLDGFRYRDISGPLETFRMLATLQQVDLKSGEEEDAYCCLLPCWSKNDLFAMGALIYKFVREDMKERFYYSGGSVREFILATSDAIRNRIDNTISSVGDVSNLLSKHFCVSTEGSQVDRICHTFINDTDDIGIRSFTTRRCWKQVIDSKYAALVLAMKLPSDALYQIYTWAKYVENRSLAEGVFEMYIHRLAADNKLELYISEYDPPEKRSNESRHFVVHQVRLKNGSALCRGTVNEHETVLINWRDDARYSYWFPRCNNFPNIGSIVKLESGNVAYLQFTVTAKNGIDAGQLRNMSAIFPGHVRDAGNTKRPIYIAVCPDLESCKALVLDSSGVHNARQVCRVYVGYFAENPFGTAADSSLTTELIKSWPPPLKYNPRKRPRMD